MPIIFLFAKDSEIDKIQGLTVGVHDYIPKFFGSISILHFELKFGVVAF